MDLHSVIGELLANGGSSLALVPALEWAKRSGLPFLKWIKIETAPLISVLSAILIALGIHFSFDATAGTLTITGLTLAGTGQAAFEIGKQWLTQHWTHKGYQAFDTMKSIAVALNKITETPTASVAGATSTGDGKTP